MTQVVILPGVIIIPTGRQVFGRTEGGHSILTDFCRDLGRRVPCSRASVSDHGEGHHFWKRIRPRTEGTAQQAVKSLGPRAGPSGLKSQRSLAVCPWAHYLTPMPQFTHRSAPNLIEKLKESNETVYRRQLARCLANRRSQ